MEEHPPSPVLKVTLWLRGLRVKPAMTTKIGFFYFRSIVHFIGLIRMRSILSVIFNGKLVFSFNLMLLYLILAAHSPITKVLNRTIWFSTGGKPSLLSKSIICTQGKLSGIPSCAETVSEGSAK